jgi:hypothetical protein
VVRLFSRPLRTRRAGGAARASAGRGAAARQFGGHLPRLLRRGEHRSRLGQEAFAGRGEPDPPGRPVEELHAEVAFEPADLLADRGLDDVQPLRRAGEVQLLGHRREVGQLPELHAASVHHDS